MFANTQTTTIASSANQETEKQNQLINNSYTPVKVSQEGSGTESGGNSFKRQNPANMQNYHQSGEPFPGQMGNGSFNSDVKQGVKSLQMNVSSVPFNYANLYGSAKKNQGLEEGNAGNYTKTNPYFLNNYPSGGAQQYTGSEKGYFLIK